MKPFVHKKRIGNFFDVLAAPTGNDAQVFSVQKGATGRQDAVVSVLSGDLGLEQMPAFAASLCELLTSTVQIIVLDLSRINSFCPNAASVLVNFVSFAEGGKKQLILYQPSHCVRSMFDSLHLKSLFTIRETEDDLLLNLPD